MLDKEELFNVRGLNDRAENVNRGIDQCIDKEEELIRNNNVGNVIKISIQDNPVMANIKTSTNSRG